MNMNDINSEVNVSKYTTLLHKIQNMNMRHVRDTYRALRQSSNNNVDLFFPRMGFTAGEFAVAHVMKMPRRSRL